MKIAKVVLFFCLLVNFAYSGINEYFPTLAEYKLLGDRAYDQAIRSPSIKPKYDDGAASVEGVIIYLQSALKHDEIDEEKLKVKFDLLKFKLTPLMDALSDKSINNMKLNHSDKFKANIVKQKAQSGVGDLAIVKVEDPLGLKKLWEEIFNYFNKIHGEKVRANEEDIKQLDRYKWKK